MQCSSLLALHNKKVGFFLKQGRQLCAFSPSPLSSPWTVHALLWDLTANVSFGDFTLGGKDHMPENVWEFIPGCPIAYNLMIQYLKTTKTKTPCCHMVGQICGAIHAPVLPVGSDWIYTWAEPTSFFSSCLSCFSFSLSLQFCSLTSPH